MTKKTTSFAPKDRIEHKLFGTGTILELDQWHTVIAFDNGETKKFVTSIVKFAPSDTEAPAKPVRRKKKKAAAKKTTTKKTATKKAATKKTATKKAATKKTASKKPAAKKTK
jgi:hypothetical protein